MNLEADGRSLSPEGHAAVLAERERGRREHEDLYQRLARQEEMMGRTVTLIEAGREREAEHRERLQ